MLRDNYDRFYFKLANYIYKLDLKRKDSLKLEIKKRPKIFIRVYYILN